MIISRMDFIFLRVKNTPRRCHGKVPLPCQRHSPESKVTKSDKSCTNLVQTLKTLSNMPKKAEKTCQFKVKKQKETELNKKKETELEELKSN